MIDAGRPSYITTIVELENQDGQQFVSPSLREKQEPSRKETAVNPLGNEWFREALGYGTYHPVDRSSYYDDEAVRSVTKWAKSLQV